jgi:type IV pilus assembly protein PilB
LTVFRPALPGKYRFIGEGEMNRSKRFGEILLAMDLITREDLEQALSWQQVSKKPLGQILMEMGVVSYQDVLRIMSKQFDTTNMEGIKRPPVP